MVKDLRAGNVADACQRTTRPSACIGGLALAKGLLGDLSKFIPSDWERGLDRATVDVHGNHATLNAKGDKTQYVKQNGRWLEVWTND